MSDNEAVPLVDSDPETTRLLPRRQCRRRVRIQGQLAIVRTVSVSNLQQAKNGNGTGRLSTDHKDVRGSPLRRQDSYDGSEVGDEEDGDDVAKRDAQFRGYGIGGAGNIRMFSVPLTKSANKCITVAVVPDSRIAPFACPFLEYYKTEQVEVPHSQLVIVAASGIAVAQVAAQVGKSIIKLKQLWDELRNVPSTIGDLLDQIECLDPALWEAENTFDQASLPPMFWDNGLASRSTAYCRKALSSLTELVDELTLQINRPGKFRSKIASAKVVLKKEQLKTLERRLQNAVRMLTLAQQSYLVLVSGQIYYDTHIDKCPSALTRVQPNIIIQKFTEITTPLIVQTLQRDFQFGQLESSDACRRQLPSQATKPAVDGDVENNVPTLRQPPHRRGSGRSFRFRVPWLSQTTWELQSSRSYGNWKLNLRCYSAVPMGSEVFEIARVGTPRELQMLCARGLASPYDRHCMTGFTLLHLAMWSLNQPMVEHLLDIGLDLSEGTNSHTTDRLESFFDFLDTPSDPERKACTCDISLRSKVLNKFFRRFECPSHETTPLESRLKRLKFFEHFVNDPMVIPEYLQPYWSRDLRAVCATSTGTINLVHVMARKLGFANEEFIEGWTFLADLVIGNTPNIHIVGPRDVSLCRLLDGMAPRTPLMALIRTLFACWGRHKEEVQIYSRLRLWLSMIRSNGYDLEKYGRREMELLGDNNLNLDRHVAVGRCNKTTGQWSYHSAQLRGYEYGSEPKDWKILLSFPENSYAADFWRLIGEGLRVMPGTWIEESDEEEGYTIAQFNSLRQDASLKWWEASIREPKALGNPDSML
ncbi:hypothetical protein EKO27_g2574 [Xylaria grammica]|uniref:Uncharacterized protein n=1 Tax=Xylaria grammica TaxID=363999 RepID=A0A439DDW7_9PEZI|nr:hypothetical protein EKO27_g2574 [Xylaria grammica]